MSICHYLPSRGCAGAEYDLVPSGPAKLLARRRGWLAFDRDNVNVNVNANSNLIVPSLVFITVLSRLGTSHQHIEKR
jgi:hypothetical protein